MTSKSSFAALSALLLALAATAQDLPPPTSPEFCQAAQRILANTDMEGTNTIFDNMPDYRASKPAPDPLMIYQVVQYQGSTPILVSCKVKSSDHLRAVYGENAAGEQERCVKMARRIQAQAVVDLTQAGLHDAANKAGQFVVDDAEPYLTGREYLSDFELSYTGEDGAVHIATPGLQSNWDTLMRWIMPDRVMGQTYCHLATVDYFKGLATGDFEIGTLMTAADDAPTVPR